MKHGDWLLTGVLAAAAAGIALVALSLTGLSFRVEWLLAAGLIVLSLAQIAAILSGRRNFESIRQQLSQVQAVGRQEHDRRAGVMQRLEALESRPSQALPRSETQSLADEVKALRSTLRGLSEKQARRAQREPRFASSIQPSPAASASPGGFSPDKLDLYLEPIVNLEDNSTAHYRASVELRAGDGRRVSAASLIAEAESSGMRPALDRFAYERCLRVAGRIIERRPNTRVFVPVSLASYGAPGELQSFETLQEADRSIANALVLELSDKDLSKLDAQGMDGIAQLARRGCTLALSFSRPMSADLPALRELNVRYLVCPAQLIPSFSQVVTSAAKSGFLIVVSDVGNAHDLEQAKSVGALGCGKQFAPPRLVRSDLSSEKQRARAA